LIGSIAYFLLQWLRSIRQCVAALPPPFGNGGHLQQR
jgi:hypothetical protein